MTGLVQLAVLEESLWHKLLGIVPHLGVHVHGVQQGDDVGVLWDDVPIKLDSPIKKVQ